MTGKGQTSSFCMWISSFPSTICWKDCPFSSEWPWHPCQKSSAYIFLWSICLSLLCQHWLDYYNFAVSFESRMCESYSFVLFQSCFAPLGFLEIPWVIGLFYFCIKVLEILRIARIYNFFQQCFVLGWPKRFFFFL